MAKLDLSKIAGYENMTAEEKLKALEAYEIDDPDYSGYIKKDSFDKTASELAEYKRKYKALLDDDAARKESEEEMMNKMREDYEALQRKVTISEKTAEFLALGYSEDLAGKAATAIADGDMKKLMKYQKEHLEAFEAQIKAGVLKDTPRPSPDGKDDEVMTLEKFRKMSLADRESFARNNPEEYSELYNGGND